MSSKYRVQMYKNVLNLMKSTIPIIHYEGRHSHNHQNVTQQAHEKQSTFLICIDSVHSLQVIIYFLIM